jgi:hypothetical protein
LDLDLGGEDSVFERTESTVQERNGVVTDRWEIPWIFDLRKDDFVFERTESTVQDRLGVVTDR